MSGYFDIRRARADDEAAVRQCTVEAYEQYVAAIGKNPAPMEADFASLIGLQNVYVAVDLEAHILGYIVFFPQGDQMFLENVAVCRNARGKGVGK